MKNSVGEYFLGILKWLDEGLNVIIIGLIGFFVEIPAPDEDDAHATVSQVLAELRERGVPAGCIGCKVLTWIQNKIFRVKGDHCTQALENWIEGNKGG